VRNRALGVLGVGVAGSQAGHLATYQIRFGALADGIQGAGAHAYFPLVAKTCLGLAGVALIATLAFIGVARILRSGRAVRWTRGPTYVSLLACLFTLQLALFMTQETVEAAAAGVPPDSAVNLLLWGILGQLPVALVGAAGLRWLWSQVEAAAEVILEVIRTAAPAPVPAPVVIFMAGPNDLGLLRSHSARFRVAKRGPPTSF